MELSNMNYDDALNFVNNSEDATLEHLLKLDVFYCENKINLLDWLPAFTNAAWRSYGITMSYDGYSTHPNTEGEQDLAEIFFRSDRILTEDEFREILDYTMAVDDNNGITLYSVQHKTMIVDEFEEEYHDLTDHWSINSYQSLYDFTDEEMKDIFGDDWEMFSEEATK